MNIYIHIETVSRELDSKLLLAIKAAGQGHDVLLSPFGIFDRLNSKGLLIPGIFHTKDLTPVKHEIQRNKKLQMRGYVISSIDEEGGLVDFDYENFAKTRYSIESIEPISAIFCWGPNDYTTLRRIYPQYSDKFYMTGSPRADLWKKEFSPYWWKPSDAPKRPYILVSSNFGLVNHHNGFSSVIRYLRKDGYFDRDTEKEQYIYWSMSEQIQLLYEFVKAIEFLAKKRGDIDIVVRPHPVEDPMIWKALLPPQPNIHVIRTGPISPWMHNALVTIHNGCTTALEATISGKPLISYIPFKQKFSRELPNQLGKIVYTMDDLLNEVNSLTNHNLSSQNDITSQTNDIINDKIFIKDDELSINRIVNIWNEIGCDLPEKKNNWIILALMINSYFFLKNIGNAFLQNKNTECSLPLTYYKYPPLSIKEIRDKVNFLSDNLNIKVPIKVKMIGDRAIIVVRKDRIF